MKCQKLYKLPEWTQNVGLLYVNLDPYKSMILRKAIAKSIFMEAILKLDAKIKISAHKWEWSELSDWILDL